MDYVSTNLGADSSSFFLFRADTNRRDWTPFPGPIQPAWVMISWWLILFLDDVGGRAFVTTDEERVLRGGW